MWQEFKTEKEMEKKNMVLDKEHSGDNWQKEMNNALQKRTLQLGANNSTDMRGVVMNSKFSKN